MIQTNDLISRIGSLIDLTNIQLQDGNWDYDPYMHGMANGLILALSTLLDVEPDYKEEPIAYLSNIGTEESMSIAGSLLKKLGEGAQPDSEDWGDFEANLKVLSKLVTSEEIARSLDDVIFNKLDKPLSREIDLVLSGSPYKKEAIVRALADGERSQGTEPRAALSGAAAFIFDAIRKLKGIRG